MNKKIMNALTGVVVSTTMMGTNVIPVLAEETIEEMPVQEIVFETPEQFIETYINVETNSVDVPVEVFEQQTLEMQEQICALCEAQELALNLIEPVEQQPEQEQPVEQPEQEQPVEQPQEQQEQAEQPAVEEIFLSVQEVAEPEEEVVLEVAQAPEQVQPEVEQPQPAQTLMEAPILEKVVSQPESVQEQAEQPTVQQVQPLANVLKESSSEDSTAQNFVDTYLSANGVVYTAADSSNYQRILAGVTTWNQMSTKQKAKVNSILTRSANKTYQQLLQEAQAIQVQQTGTTSTYVNGRIVTGTQTNQLPMVMALVGAAILAILAFLGLKKKNK